MFKKLLSYLVEVFALASKPYDVGSAFERERVRKLFSEHSDL